MQNVKIRYQKINDAKRFYEILNNPKFKFFSAKPKSVEEEKEFLKKNKEKIKRNFEHNFTILFNDVVVGGVGIKIDQHKTYVGEIGYFLDADYWGRGITTKAVKLVEKIGFRKFKLTRIEILMNIKNIASKRVAQKAGYKLEGIMKGKIRRNKDYSLMYAKVRYVNVKLGKRG